FFFVLFYLTLKLISIGGISQNVQNGVLMQNVALSRTADQSSSHPDGPARNAVDGNRDPNFAKGSCSLTHQESNPWWRVDLQNVYTVTAVMITNRNEFENRLDGAEIWIGNSLEDNGAKKSRCAIISHIPKGRTFYFPCSSTEGRYVTVFLPGTKKILTLCEVEVFPSDYADGKAFQSSTASGSSSASKAIDGRRDSTYYKGFCTHTLEETNPWWRLDLRETHAVTSVKVTNRGDCCAQRLDGAEIRIGNSAENNGNDNPKCASISHIGAGKTVTFYCEGGSVMGRFVNVIIPGPKKILTLCEVEVYAGTTVTDFALFFLVCFKNSDNSSFLLTFLTLVDPLANVAPNGQATQSSLYANNVHAVNVINGDMTGLCSHTANQSSPWWKLDLLAVHRVRAVTIFNRPDCCPERLIGAEILIGNSPSTEVTQNPR
uniref:Fucolectin tachylectin-4 pentraxin-1 domain-containing protein n=1 Tax=Labrus bergylta TaxID=56723 RepID=A0A3Q3MF10_9LABR